MTHPRQPAFRRPRRLTALAAGVVAAVLAGCSVVPSGTGAQPASAPAPPPGSGQCCGLLVRPPQPGWRPEVVVRYFLLASAISAHNYSAARQYLTSKASQSWQPGPAVTILNGEPQVSRPPVKVNGPGPEAKLVVLAAGQEQARLSSTGQYIPATGGAPAPKEQFILEADKNGIYKINQFIFAGKNSPELLLTSDLFHLEYTPRNLYYYGGPGGDLLPYPVFVPFQGTNPAATLVHDLINGPSGWLHGAALTAFPADAHPVPPIQVFPGPSGGRTAVVNIAVPHATPAAAERQLAIQLVATLTSPVYGTPLFRDVKIKINGRFWPPRHPAGEALGQAFYAQSIARFPYHARAYYLSQGGGLRSLTASAGHGTVVPEGSGAGQVPLTSVAVSLNGQHLAVLAGPATTVYTGNLTASGPGRRLSAGQLHEQLTGTSFTSLSWDSAGDLWVAGRKGIWVLPGGQGPALIVKPASGLGSVTGLRVAPDGVRVAMIVSSGAAAPHLVLAAAKRGQGGISLTTTAPLGPALPPVTALSWYDEDHLLVVTGSGSSSQLWEVPVNGDNPASLIKESGITAVTGAGPGNPIYISLSGQLERAVRPNQPFSPITPGQAVIYPG